MNAVSESGATREVSFNVVVQEPEVEETTGAIGGETDTTVVLAVILVIVFVVLVIILIVLLTKKPAETEEFGETNYY